MASSQLIPMFTPKDRRWLACFCEVCDNIQQRRFIIDLPKQPSYICVGRLPNGQVFDEYPRYDIEDFRSFLADYRKLRSKDKTNLSRILALLKSNGDPNDVPLLQHYEAEIAEEGNGWWMATIPDRNGGKKLLTQVEVENLIFNGEVFHPDLDKRDDLAKLVGKAGLMKTVACINYLRFVRVVICMANKTSELIRSRGYLA